jgi:uncharacterized protein (TIGR00255 family)
MMNVKSMTGYGRAEKNYQDKRIIVEIKSLNSKQNDLLVKLPSIYSELEIDIRNVIGSRLKRGKIYCQINIEYNENSKRLNINKPLVVSYINELREIIKLSEFHENSDLLSIAMRLPDVVSTDSQKLSANEISIVNEIVIEALNLIDLFRAEEGEILANDFLKRIEIIATLLTEIQPFEDGRLTKIRERIENELINFGTKINIDQNRLEQELIFYLEKLDITEEKIRLTKHLEYFSNTLNDKEEEKGKKLAFVIQEIGREINTLGSKANDAAMQKLVVQMKDELEKIKEQLLNIL